MEEMTSMQWQLLAPLIVIQIILQISALVSLKKAMYVRGPKLVWVVFILISGMLGSIVYFIVGRKR